MAARVTGGVVVRGARVGALVGQTRAVESVAENGGSERLCENNAKRATRIREAALCQGRLGHLEMSGGLFSLVVLAHGFDSAFWPGQATPRYSSPWREILNTTWVARLGRSEKALKERGAM